MHQIGIIFSDLRQYLSVFAGEAEKDYWNTIRGIQGKYKDSRSYKGRYQCVLGQLCLVLSLCLVCTVLSQEVHKRTSMRLMICLSNSPHGS